MSSKVDAVPAVNPATVDAQELKQAINRVLICTTKEPSRFRLNVVKFESTGTELRLTATDGHRASVATIHQVELAPFEFLVSIDDCKSIKKMCRRKKDVITVQSTADGLSFQNPKGDKVEVHPVGDTSEFPPLDHILEVQTTGTIPVVDPGEFRRGVKLAHIARLDGERNFKASVYSNLIRLISTGRKLTVFGRSRQSSTRSVFHLESDDRATGVSVAANANYLLDLLKVLPSDESINLGYWKNGTEGMVVRTENFQHVLCGITEKRGMRH